MSSKRPFGFHRKAPKGSFTKKPVQSNGKRSNHAKTVFIPSLGVEKEIVRQTGFGKDPRKGILHFSDGSVLYSFGNGQTIFLTRKGRALVKANQGIIGDYINKKTPKGFLAAGGNANVYVTPVKDAPRGEPLIAVKEYHSGLSPLTQKAHLEELRKATKKKKNVKVPEVFLAATAEHGKTPTGYLAMQFIPSNKVSVTIENLEKRIASTLQNSPQRKSYVKMLEQLKRDYASFEKRMRSNPKIKKYLTDFDQGNILTKYNPKTREFEFILIDQ